MVEKVKMKELYKELLELKIERARNGKNYGALKQMAEKYDTTYSAMQAKIRMQQKYHQGVNDAIAIKDLPDEEIINKLIFLK